MRLCFKHRFLYDHDVALCVPRDLEQGRGSGEFLLSTGCKLSRPNCGCVKNEARKLPLSRIILSVNLNLSLTRAL
jgi:hypothetical protein